MRVAIGCRVRFLQIAGSPRNEEILSRHRGTKIAEPNLAVQIHFFATCLRDSNDCCEIGKRFGVEKLDKIKRTFDFGVCPILHWIVHIRNALEKQRIYADRVRKER